MFLLNVYTDSLAVFHFVMKQALKYHFE